MIRATSRSIRSPRLAIGWLFSLVIVVGPPDIAMGGPKPDLATYERRVLPLLNQYCRRCHGSRLAEAEICFDTIDPDIIYRRHFGKWEDIHEAFHTGEMPPEDQPQPTAAQRDVITKWLEAEFKKARQSGVSGQRGSVRRLTRYELRYALEDLLRIPTEQEVEALPEEAASLETGLQNDSQLLMISGPHLEAYLNVIQAVIEKTSKLVVLQPQHERLNIAEIDTRPNNVASKRRSNRLPVIGVERTGNGLRILPNGHVDLAIPSISQGSFEISLTANAPAKVDGPARLRVQLGRRNKGADGRRRSLNLGYIDITGPELAAYSLSGQATRFPAEMVRTLEVPFAIRVSNPGSTDVHLETLEYLGNIEAESLSQSILGQASTSDIRRHFRPHLKTFIERAFRRATTDEELERYYESFRSRLKADPRNTTPALLLTYQEILCPPRFFCLE